MAYIKPAHKFAFEQEEDDMGFNPSNPIVTFKIMMSFNKEDLVLKALKEMNQYILNKLAFSVTG